MAEQRLSAHRPAVAPQRQALAARASPAAAVPSRIPASRAVQQRLGNLGTQALAAQVVARSAVSRLEAPTSAPRGTLAISHPADPAEREAERVADTIMRMAAPVSPESANATPAQAVRTGLVQRRCSQCMDEDKGTMVQRKESSAATSKQTRPLTADIGALKGGGRPLPAASRAFFEPRFGADFSHVRLHTGLQAARVAADIQAHAFTHGQDIYFGAGQYRPETREGQHLLAHELTHTVQQQALVSGGVARLDRYSWGEFVGDAEAVGDAVSKGANTVVDTVTSTAVSIGQAVESEAEAGVKAVSGAVVTAVSWLQTEAGQLALQGARQLAALVGGAVKIVGTGIVISIPDMELCTARSIPMTMPMANFFVPLAGWAAVFGPVGIGAAAGLRFGLQPSVAFSYGPCRLRKMSLLLDPLAGTYAGSGQLYIAGAVTDTLVGEAALKAIGIVGLIDPPFALMAGVEGGLRATLRGVGAGALQETVRVAYSGGAFSLDLDSTVKLGGAVELALDFFANASLYDFVVCEYVLPLVETTLLTDASRWDFPVRVTKGGVTAGPLTEKPIPFGDIEVFVNRQRPETRCLSLAQIKEELCKRGYLPPLICSTSGPSGKAPLAPSGGKGVPSLGGPAASDNRMRSQIQQFDTHFGSAAVEAADPAKGVTAREFEGAQAAAKANALEPRTGKKEQMPRSWIPGVDKAKSEQSRRIRTETIPKGGIPETRTGDINELRVCFDPANNNLMKCGGRIPVRLDVENSAGHNLKHPK